MRTTTPDPTPPPIPDRVHGAFTAPDVLWVGHIHPHPDAGRLAVLATVIDVFSRRVIGFAVPNHMRAALVCDALSMAAATRGGTVAGVIFHTDRGSRYRAAECHALCKAHGIKQSMGKTGVR